MICVEQGANDMIQGQLLEHFVSFCPAHCYYYCFTHVFIEQINDDDDDDMVQLMSLPPHHFLLRQYTYGLVVPFGAGLPRLSWKRGH